MIRFACPGCAATFTVGDEKAGKSGKCPKCQSQFIIPAAEGATPSADVPPPLPSEPPPLPREAAPTSPPPDPDAPVEILPCPKCTSRLSVLPADVGQDIQCPHCDTVFRARRADAPPPPGGSGKSKSSSLVKLGSSGDRKDEDDPDDRPSRRRRSRREDDEDDEDRPSRRRRSRYDDERDDEDDDRPSRRRSRRSRRDDDYDRPSKPGDVQTLGVLLLVGGISAVLYGLGAAGGSTGICCLWPGTYYELVYGIMAIVRASQLLGQNDSPEPPRGLFIMAIICIVNLDVLNLVLGIVGLNMLNNPAVQDYYSRR